MDAICAFAGELVSRAVVEPDAVAALVSFDEAVQHYQVVEEVLDANSPSEAPALWARPG